MSEATFDATAEALMALDWNMDLRAASELAPHMQACLRDAAAWAQRFDVTSGWFKTDYAALAVPGIAPPQDRIAPVIAACRGNGEASRYGATYIDLILRWEWATEKIENEGLAAPYAGAKQILLSGSGLDGEHGFIGPGLSSLRIGTPADHL